MRSPHTCAQESIQGQPVLLLSGTRSVRALKLIATKLAEGLPSVQFVVLENATHQMWIEVPRELTERILPFLITQRVSTSH